MKPNAAENTNTLLLQAMVKGWIGTLPDKSGKVNVVEARLERVRMEKHLLGRGVRVKHTE